MRYLYLILIFILFQNCDPVREYNYSGIGMKPIYANGDSIYDIKNVAVQPIINSGSIYSWNQYLLVGESNKGIHIIDKSDPSNPFKISFIKIIGNKNFSIADSTLYADNGKDLITIDIRNINSIQVLNIVKNSLQNDNVFPTNYIGYFECYDKSKGIVVGWDSVQLNNPKCFK